MTLGSRRSFAARSRSPRSTALSACAVPLRPPSSSPPPERVAGRHAPTPTPDARARRRRRSSTSRPTPSRCSTRRRRDARELRLLPADGRRRGRHSTAYLGAPRREPVARAAPSSAAGSPPRLGRTPPRRSPMPAVPAPYYPELLGDRHDRPTRTGVPVATAAGRRCPPGRRGRVGESVHGRDDARRAGLDLARRRPSAAHRDRVAHRTSSRCLPSLAVRRRADDCGAVDRCRRRTPTTTLIDRLIAAPSRNSGRPCSRSPRPAN